VVNDLFFHFLHCVLHALTIVRVQSLYQNWHTVVVRPVSSIRLALALLTEDWDSKALVFRVGNVLGLAFVVDTVSAVKRAEFFFDKTDFPVADDLVVGN
jgi:hypothetical protein